MPEAQQSVLERMRFAEKHLLGIIEGILDLQRSSDETPLEVKEMPVAEAADGLATMVAPIAEKHGVDFTLDVEGDDGSVWANPAKLRQVLLNLITNALECTPRGGRVWVDHLDTLEGAVFRVHDTGPGIPQEQLEAIFEPFVQLDMSLTRERGGIGLGLAISQQLAHRMGGRITATSEIGKGSTFTVVLRNSLEPQEKAPPEGKGAGVA
jgi:signal transduction histidine kinase